VTPKDQRRVVGAFAGPTHAARAREGLKAAGFTPEQIAGTAGTASATQPPSGNTEPGRARETTLGGAFLGGVAGWLVGISALVLPGIGPIAGAAIIAPVLAGAGLGAVVGRLIGAPGEEAATREEDVLLTVHAGGERQAREARSILERAGATDTRVYRAPAQ
jgi:hypothetical protein